LSANGPNCIELSWRQTGVARGTDSRSNASDLIHVTAVDVVGEHRLHLTFEDGAEGELDFATWRWRGVFEPLADVAYFEQVTLDEELGTIVWPNGADIAPETLYSWVAPGLKPASV
jgi:hypothetical protein